MRKISKKGKLILMLLVFLLITPLVIFYTLEGTGFFDSRSRASLVERLPERLKFADLNADNVINLTDFGIWLKDFRAFKNDSSYNERSDFDKNKTINLSDFALWLPAFREYKTIKDSRRPTVVTLEATGACSDYTLRGEITDNGGEDVTTRGFLYSDTVENPFHEAVSNGEAVKVLKNEGDYEKVLGEAELKASTKYYYRAFAKNAVGYAYGEVKTFVTSKPLAETVDFEILDNLDVNLTGKAHGCGFGLPEKGFVYSDTAKDDAGLRRGTEGVGFLSGGEGAALNGYTLTLPFARLTGNTKYYYRAYTKNGKGEIAYGEIDEFKTENLYARTLSATGIWQKTATLQGKAMATRAELLVKRGFVYSDQGVKGDLTLRIGEGGVTNVDVPNLEGLYKRGSYEKKLNGLDKGRIYYYRAYVEGLEGRVIYGDIFEFRTKSLVELTTNEATSWKTVDDKSAGATLKGSVISSSSDIKRIGFLYSKENDDPKLTGNNVTVRNFCVNTGCEEYGSEEKEVDLVINLLPSDTYFRIFAVNDDGISYGGVKKFTPKEEK